MSVPAALQGLNAAERTVLAELAATDRPVSQHDLAQRCELRPSAVAAAARELVRRELARIALVSTSSYSRAWACTPYGAHHARVLNPASPQ